MNWITSSRCNEPAGACVEVTFGPGAVFVRDSTHGPRLIFSIEEWTTFLAGVKHGDFDLEAQA